jgi:two-component system sensor histidine kinase QseC
MGFGENLPVCLWYDKQAEEAANFYVAVFRGAGRQAAITDELRWGEVGHGTPGSILTVSFELEGRPFVALDGGPHYTHSPAASLMVMCRTQKEIDYFWDKLQEGGGQPVQCGWLTDKYGLSWQVAPPQLLEFLKSSDKAAAGRAMQAMMGMVKLDLPALTKAFEGG